MEAERRTWTCDICGQTVVMDMNGTNWLPQGFFDNCRLREHLIGDECIAFRDLERAVQVLEVGGSED